MDLDFERRIVYRALPDADLPLLHIVLPLVFHQPTALALERTVFAAGLLRALDRVPDLTVQLSERMQDMSPITSASINLATASGLLQVEPTEAWPVFSPGRESLPVGLAAR